MPDRARIDGNDLEALLGEIFHREIGRAAPRSGWRRPWRWSSRCAGCARSARRNSWGIAHRLFLRPLGRALFQKRADAFLRLLRAACSAPSLRRHSHRRCESAKLELVLERVLAELQGGGGLARDVARERIGFLLEFRGRDHAIDEPDAARFMRVDRPRRSAASPARPCAAPRAITPPSVSSRRARCSRRASRSALRVEATARSQLATSWQPAAVATPCTWAMTGLGCRTIVCIRWLHCAKIAR